MFDVVVIVLCCVRSSRVNTEYLLTEYLLNTDCLRTSHLTY